MKVAIRLDTSDIACIQQVWNSKEYQPIINLMKEHGYRIHSMPFIIDAGAYIGISTLFFKQHFPLANVYCIEPDFGNYCLLEQNLIRLNNNPPTIANCALHNKADLVCFSVDGKKDPSRWAKQITFDRPSLDAHRIFTNSIDGIRKARPVEFIDLLKIDIEGSERFLFEDDSSAAETLEHTKFLAIEVHERWFPLKATIISYLDKHNFEWFDRGETTFGVNRNLVPKPAGNER